MPRSDFVNAISGQSNGFAAARAEIISIGKNS